MADVVVQPNIGSAISQPFDIIGGIVDFFVQNWAWLLLITILIILVIVIFVIINKMNEERKERDEPGYQLYKTTKSACDLNKDEMLIRKKPRYGLLWLFLTPFFWLFFVLKDDRSARILDYTGRHLGFYRGELTMMDNTLNILAYKEKWLIFFEKQFVIKIPLEFRFTEKYRDASNNFVYEIIDGKKVLKYEEKILRFDKFVRRLNNGDIQLEATGLEQVGMYYKCPTFVIRETGQVVDYRKLMEGAVIDSTYQQMTTRLLNLGAKMMEKGMQLNPSLQYAKQSPEKTKPEEDIDRDAR